MIKYDVTCERLGFHWEFDSRESAETALNLIKSDIIGKVGERTIDKNGNEFIIKEIER